LIVSLIELAYVQDIISHQARSYWYIRYLFLCHSSNSFAISTYSIFWNLYLTI